VTRRRRSIKDGEVIAETLNSRMRPMAPSMLLPEIIGGQQTPTHGMHPKLMVLMPGLNLHLLLMARPRRKASPLLLAERTRAASARNSKTMKMRER